MKTISSAFIAFAKALIRIFGDPGEAFRRQEAEKKAKARSILKHFKIEVTPGFFGPKVKMIQRDKPLTDKEVDQLP